MNKQKVIQCLESLEHTITFLIECGGAGSGNWGHSGRPGRLGGSGSGGGSGGGAVERYRDRIEGTQEEADNEVKKADKAVKKAEKALKAAEKRRDANISKIIDLTKQLGSVRAKKEAIKKDIDDSLTRSAALQKRLDEINRQLGKSLREEMAKIIDKLNIEIASAKKGIKEIRSLVKQIDGITKQADLL